MISKDEAQEAIKYMEHVIRHHEWKASQVKKLHEVEYQQTAARNLRNSVKVLKLYLGE